MKEAQKVELIPFCGFDNVRLGIGLHELRNILGDPTSEEITPYGDHWLHYFDLGVSCCFGIEDEGRLDSLVFRSSRYVVSGIEIVGLAEEELVRLGKGILHGLVLEEDIPFIDAKNYECDSLGLSFWVKSGTVVEATLFARYDSSGNRVYWPDGTEG